MTAARDIAKLIRKFLNDNNLKVSDLQRGLVVLINGKLGPAEVRLPEAEGCRT